MDFNLPDLPPNNYTQNLSSPLPTQISLDQLMAQTSNKTSDVSVDEMLAGLGINNTILPEPVKIKKDEVKNGNDDEKED